MKSVLVTTSWDDGHKLDMRLARLLKKYGLKATFYIAPEDREFVRGDRLSDQEIKQLSKDFEIGAHTITHPRLTQVDHNSAKQEIIASKKYLEKVIRKPVHCFCYPGGMYDSGHVQMVKNAGFDFARTVGRFNFSLPQDNFEAGTTVHAYRHWSDALKILRFAKCNPSKFIRFLMNWDELAMALFDAAAEQNGVFHIWGHSWEVDANDDWARLERVFRYIAENHKIHPVTNEEIVRPPAHNDE